MNDDQKKIAMKHINKSFKYFKHSKKRLLYANK